MELSWSHLGAILESSWSYLGVILELSWSHIGAILELSWSYLGAILELSWSHLGDILEPYSTRVPRGSNTFFFSVRLADCPHVCEQDPHGADPLEPAHAWPKGRADDECALPSLGRQAGAL